MINPDEKVLNAINLLDGNPDFEIVRRWIKESLYQAFIESSTPRMDVPMYPFNAGRAFELKDMLNKMERSRETLEAIQKGKR